MPECSRAMVRYVDANGFVRSYLGVERARDSGYFQIFNNSPREVRSRPDQQWRGQSFVPNGRREQHGRMIQPTGRLFPRQKSA